MYKFDTINVIELKCFDEHGLKLNLYSCVDKMIYFHNFNNYIENNTDVEFKLIWGFLICVGVRSK